MGLFSALWTRADREQEQPVESPSPAASGLRVENRRYTRYEDGRSTFIFPVIGTSSEVTVRDASAQGMRIVSRDQLEVGSRMLLVVFYGGSSARFMVQVLWERPDESQRKRQYGVRVLPASRREEAQLNEYLKFVRLRPSSEKVETQS